MSDTPLEHRHAPKGRPADLLATLMAASGAVLSTLGAIWFFAGFAENDTRPEHLASALLLTISLFVLAIAPFSIVAIFARRAHQQGGLRRHYLWTLLLMIPWIALGTLTLTYTPLPKWAGVIALLLSSCLTLWALVSLVLDLRIGNSSDTQALGEIEQTEG